MGGMDPSSRRSKTSSSTRWPTWPRRCARRSEADSAARQREVAIMLRRRLALWLLIGSQLVSFHGAHADTGAESCRALERADFSKVTDAPSQITATEFIAQAHGMPAHCHIQ